MTSPRRVHSAGDQILSEIADVLADIRTALGDIRDRLPQPRVEEPVTARQVTEPVPAEPPPEATLMLVTEPAPAPEPEAVVPAKTPRRNTGRRTTRTRKGTS